MTRSPLLKLESLETREVPAIVLQGTLNNSGTPQVNVTANGGAVLVEEIALNSDGDSNRTDGAPDVVRNQALNAFVTVTRSGTENDNITLDLNGSTLRITNSDGIFVRYDFNGVRFQSVGNVLEVQNVTGLNVNLQLGGDDTITDNTNLTATLNGGIGNDTITATGGAVNPLLLQLLQQPGGINPALLPLLGGVGGQKIINGGAGDDRITGPSFGLFNMLDGGDGSDTIVGGFGPDFITGGNGFDILFGFGGNDFYIAFDFGPDFIVNQPGDTVFGDTFDIKNP